MGTLPPEGSWGGMLPESDREKLKSMTANIMLLFFDIKMFRNRPRLYPDSSEEKYLFTMESMLIVGIV